MKRAKITSLLICGVALFSCSPNVKNMNEEEAKAYGVKLISKFFEKNLFTNRLDIEGEKSKYSFRLNYTENKDDICLVNDLSFINQYYYYSNNEVRILDAYENEVECFAITREAFLNDYLGIFKIDFNENDIKTHITKTEQFYYAKGSGSYYILDQNIVFNNDTLINLKVLNATQSFYINELSFHVKFGEIDFVRFHGYQTIDDEQKPLLFFVDTFPG